MLYALWLPADSFTIVEDTVDASRQVPRSLLWTTCANMLSCIPLVALVVLCAGDIDTLFTEPLGASGHPFGAVIQLIHNAGRQNNALSSAVFGLIAPIFMMSSINTTAAASRMLFSFVRDDYNPAVHKLMHKVMWIFLRLLEQYLTRGRISLKNESRSSASVSSPSHRF